MNYFIITIYRIVHYFVKRFLNLSFHILIQYNKFYHSNFLLFKPLYKFKKQILTITIINYYIK